MGEAGAATGPIADHHRPDAPKRKAGPTDRFEAGQSSNGSFHRIEVAIWQCARGTSRHDAR
jgi:hypothetical protein